ncbi:putative methylase [uncultured Caudovirales phage]|uniref:Putative methylase n=1 Tax=uncultured Caudovirales phage TaxID=2100421 RepID=A0A6J7X0G3_9CAUD|nr:putative methylase [uncultured Caudovirales phage]
MKVVQKPVDKLIPYINNSRTHSDEQVAQIAASIKEFGWTNPILVDGENGIIAGHGRLMAARKLGYTEVPTIELKDLTETQRKAYIIADNRLALNAGWDNEMLTIELNDLLADGFALEMLGFDPKELDALLEPEVLEGLTDEDAVPDVPEEPTSKLGDIYQLGNHRLMCGDSTSIDAVDKLMDGQKADMVFTDPPYGVEYQSNMRTKSQKFDVLANDDQFLDIAPILEVFSKGWMFVWTSWKVQTKWIEQMSVFGYPSNIVIWHKPGGGIGDLKKTFSSDYEVALVWHRGAELEGKRIGSVWKISKDSSMSYVHPTQKPVALAEEALDKTTKSKAVVMDLFGGSGSTLIACEKQNRHARLMELDPKYCDVIVKRWEDFTGKKAVLLTETAETA